MRKPLLAGLVLAIAPLALAAGFKKPYFGATKPGAWAKYDVKTSAGDMSYTYTRLADDKGQFRFEIRADFADKNTPSSLNRYTLKKGFAFEHDLMDYGPSIVAGEMGTLDDVQPTDPNTLAIIGRTIAQYGANSKFIGTETVNGKKADHYSYVVKYPSDAPQIETGEVWLSDAVPFGLVKQKATTKDESGKEISSYEEVLTDSGVSEGK